MLTPKKGIEPVQIPQWPLRTKGVALSIGKGAIAETAFTRAQEFG